MNTRVFLLTFILLLVAVSGSLLVNQWIGYEKNSKTSHKAEVEQQIQLEHDRFGLKVYQTFSRLEPGKNAAIVLPANAQSAGCVKQEAKCSFRGLGVLITPKETSATVFYSLKLPANRSALLLTDWFAKIKELKIKRTKVQLTEKTWRSGSWHSGLEATGFQRMDMIDYYVFEGEGGADSLYWQLRPLKRIAKGKNVSLYGSPSLKLGRQAWRALEAASRQKPSVIIVTDQHPAYSSDRLYLVGSSQEAAKLSQGMIRDKIEKDYRFSQNEKWLAQLLAAYELNAPPPSQKVRWLYEQLQQQLTPEEQSRWRSALLDLQGDAVTAEILDHKLSEVKGMETRFFTENKEADPPFNALVFKESRPIYINGKRAGIQPLKDQSGLFFPLRLTLGKLGFQVDKLPNERELLIVKQFDTYRLDLDQNRLILNEEEYGIYHDALRYYSGKLYIESKWMQKIFLLRMEEREGGLYIYEWTR
ncbi:hypothetical protein [Bacillus xiapuensis]|uniref:hypothetical protein n=1 Tax=Bacillus xiapuensis TaxID=2014075 RepID=UPI0018E2899C|nr:hypothetical protein [Bacillus xiapuensis]